MRRLIKCSQREQSCRDEVSCCSFTQLQQQVVVIKYCSFLFRRLLHIKVLQSGEHEARLVYLEPTSCTKGQRSSRTWCTSPSGANSQTSPPCPSSRQRPPAAHTAVHVVPMSFAVRCYLHLNFNTVQPLASVKIVVKNTVKLCS